MYFFGEAGFVFDEVCFGSRCRLNFGSGACRQVNCNREQGQGREVTVGLIIPVDEKIGHTLNATSGICVHFIAPAPDSGLRVGTAQKRVFYYDEEWGWYMY